MFVAVSLHTGMSSPFPLEMLSATEVRAMSFRRFLFASGLSYPVMPCTANTQVLGPFSSGHLTAASIIEANDKADLGLRQLDSLPARCLRSQRHAMPKFTLPGPCYTKVLL